MEAIIVLDIGDANADDSDLGTSAEDEEEETTDHQTAIAIAKSTTPPSSYVLVEARLLHDAEAVARQ